MKLRLSHRLNLYIGGILLLGLILHIFQDISGDTRLIKEIGVAEAERLSRTLFEQLYTSMRLGGGRAENRAIVERFKDVAGIKEIRIIHGAPLDEQFGVEEDELPADDYDRLALAGQTVQHIEEMEGGRKAARFILPVFVRQECTRCHNAKVGEVNGAISVTISLGRYEGAIAGHLVEMVVLGGVLILAVFIAVLAVFRRRFVLPLERLKAGAEVLALGNLDHRVNITTGDELEELGNSFDSMAASLKSITTKLNDLSMKHSRLVEMAADAIVLKDMESMAFVDANPAASILSGYSKEELVGMHSDALWPPEKIAGYKTEFARWAFDGKGYFHDAEVVKKDGFRVPVDIAASVLDINGRKFVLEIWRDTSERKGFEDTLRKNIEVLEETVAERTAELNSSLRELEEAYQKLKGSEQRLIQSAKLISLGEMGAGIAHELNSPIAGILSIAEVLIGRLSTDDPNYFLLEKIKDAAVRSKYIILDMLTYARPKKGEYTPVYVNETIRATLTIFISELKSSSIEVVEDFDPDLPRVNANQGQLMEVILNILKNARDATGGAGSIFIKTETRMEAGRKYAQVEIRDTGDGIPEEIMGRIFDPFFTTKEKGGGLNVGLGLSMSQSIIKEHEGWIEAGNVPEGGAVFRVLIPVAGEEGGAGAQGGGG